MKIVKKISIIICIILCFFVSESLATTGKVNIEATRIRKETNTSSTILTVVYEGDKVEILETQGDWYKVKYGEYTGFVKKEYISTDTKIADTTTNNITTNNTVTENISNTTNDNTQDSAENNENSTQNQVTKYVINGSVKIRMIPNMMSKLTTQLENGKEVTKELETNNWVKITDGNITGWIPNSKLSEVTSQPENTQNQVPEPTTEEKEPEQTETKKEETTESNINKTGKVNVETAKVREKASSSSTVIAFLDYNDKVTITAEDGEWYKITCDDISGYVNKKLITISTVTSRSLTEERKNNEDDTTISQEANEITTQALTNKASNGEQVVEYAKQYIGCSYVLGGKTPESGFDCSGFTKYVYSNFGYTLGNTAASQDSLGTEISREDMQSGDLILFYDEGKTKVGHTGIYMGNGNFIHAANPARGVVVDNLNSNSYYNTRFVTARRIVQ